jgi:small subunit ribosomal protein S20
VAPPPAKRTRIADTIKRHRTSEAANARNRSYRSRMRNQIKELRSLIVDGKGAEATAKLPETVSTLHKLARKGIIHRNAAARRISRLALAINKIGK